MQINPKNQLIYILLLCANSLKTWCWYRLLHDTH